MLKPPLPADGAKCADTRNRPWQKPLNKPDWGLQNKFEGNHWTTSVTFPSELVIQSQRWSDQLAADEIFKKRRRITDRGRHCPEREYPDSNQDYPPPVTTPDKAWSAADYPRGQRQINYRNERGRAFGQRRQADRDRKPADIDLVGFIFTYDRGREHPGRGQKQHQHWIWTTMIDHCHIGRIH